MEIKDVYKKEKGGTYSYTEKKYARKIIESLHGVDTTNFAPARTFEELHSLYDKYNSSDVDFTEIKKSDSSDSTEIENDSTDIGANQEGKEQVTATNNSMQDIIDPLNRDGVIIRDYVLDEENNFRKDGQEHRPAHTGDFAEPTNFGDSFTIPNDNEDEPKAKSSENTQKTDGASTEYKKPKYIAQEPLNPNFDDMSKRNQNKSSKMFARTIVEGVCKLSEMGCIYWATKDITADKILAYELNDQIDVNLVLALDGEQAITVKDFFAQQVRSANEELQISPEGKDNLTEALSAVLIEKGIAPTPMQQLAIVAVSELLIGLGVKAYAMQVQTASVLSQLIGMRADQKKVERQEIEDIFTENKEKIIEREEKTQKHHAAAKEEETSTELAKA